MTTERSGAVAYIRTSTKRQDLSPESQRHAIEQWAAARGVPIVAWHDDKGVKGSSAPETRPGMMRAVNDVRGGQARFLVAARLDRFARSVVVLDQLRIVVASAGAVLVTADGTLGQGGNDPASVFMLHVQAALAEYEVGMTHLRINETAATKRRGGRRFGNVPLGWQCSAACKCTPKCEPRKLKTGIVSCEVLVPNKLERRAGRQAAKWQAQGHSLREIGRRLQDKGHAPRGTSWHPQTVKALIEAHASGWSRD